MAPAWAQEPVPGIPYIDRAAITRTAPGDVTLHLAGHFPPSPIEGCWFSSNNSNALTVYLTHTGQICPDSVTRQWQEHLDLGQLSPGTHAVRLSLKVAEENSPDTTTYQGFFTFEIQPEPPPTLPYVTEIRIEPLYAPGRKITSNDSILVAVHGVFPTGCYSLDGFETTDENVVPRIIQMRVDRGSCRDCLGEPREFDAVLVQPPLPAGSYHQIFRMTETDCIDPDTIFAAYRQSVPFEVENAGLKYVTSITVESAHGRPGAPICPTDSVRVKFVGWLPTPCGSVDSLKALPFYPPPLQLWLELDNCQPACPTVLKRWEAEIVLPPLPPGPYALPVDVFATSCTQDSIVSTQRGYVEFQVSGECPGPGPGCIMLGFLSDSTECNALVDPGHPGQVVVTYHATVPIAGIQGNFVLYPEGLDIVNIEPIGAAQDWRIAWQKTANGARFTLFSEHGTIGPCPVITPNLARCDGRIIQVTVAARQNQLAPVFFMQATEVLASDGDGGAVYPCPTAHMFAPPTARICTNIACDVNHDGRTDVRDLVLMVRCLELRNKPGVLCADCDGDSVQSIDDVLCCAHRMLGNGPCINCPPDTLPGRPEPNVHVSLDTPTFSEQGATVPLHLTGVEHLGGARLELAFPADRYEIVGVEAVGAPSWLTLHEVRGDRVVVGMIRISPLITTDVNQPLNLTLQLRLKAGQTAGGELRSATGEFSGNDGVRLEIPFAVVQPLGGPARLALSEGRPNPFSDETVFAITLDRPADVTIGIYDLHGRLVATPQRGPLAAGSHPIVWNGRDATGAALPNGVYFALASSGDARASRKLVMLRGN